MTGGWFCPSVPFWSALLTAVVSHRLPGPWEWTASWLRMKLMLSWPTLTRLASRKRSSQRTPTSSPLAVRRYCTAAVARGAVLGRMVGVEELKASSPGVPV